MKFPNRIKVIFAISLALTGAAFAVPQELIDALGDENYQLREKAEKELAQWAKKNGKKGISELDRLKKKIQSPEVRSRLDNVISGIVVYKAIPGTEGFMGISMRPVMGASVITLVSPDTPAHKAGLQPNDKIIELDGIELSEKNNNLNEATNFLQAYVKSKNAGEKLTVVIERDGKKLTKALKLADYGKMMNKRDPFANGFNGNRLNANGFMPVLPMGGAKGGAQILPGDKNLNPKQLKLKEKERLERDLKDLKRLLGQAELPDGIEDILRQKNERSKKRLQELEQELKLKEKAAPKK